jgi:hypothetical protein
MMRPPISNVASHAALLSGPGDTLGIRIGLGSILMLIMCH